MLRGHDILQLFVVQMEQCCTEPYANAKVSFESVLERKASASENCQLFVEPILRPCLQNISFIHAKGKTNAERNKIQAGVNLSAANW